MKRLRLYNLFRRFESIVNSRNAKNKSFLFHCNALKYNVKLVNNCIILNYIYLKNPD